MHKIRIKKTHILCGIMFLLALMPNQWNAFWGSKSATLDQMFFYSKFVASALLIIYALSKEHDTGSSLQIKKSFEIFAPLFLLMLVVEILAAFFSPIPATYGIRYYSRMVSMLLQRLCIIFTVLAIYSAATIKTVDSIITVLLVDQLFVLVCGIIKAGLPSVVTSFLGAFSLREGTSNVFEVSELTFSIGLCVIYALFVYLNNKQKLGTLLVLTLCFLLGAKRIAVAAVAVAAIFALVVKRKYLSKRIISLIGCIGVGVCFVYLVLIYNDSFFAILTSSGINNMGRNLIWGYFTRRTTLDVTQIGWGIAGVAKAIENMPRSEVLYMDSVRGIHNAILGIYVDYGFVGSLLWFLFYLVYVPRKYYDYFGKRSATLYMLLSVYMFITYLTDGTHGYYTCQIIYLLLPILLSVKEKSENNTFSVA